MTINNADVASKMLDALGAMGLSIDDLIAAGQGHDKPIVTIAEYLPQVEAAATDGKKRTYATYWRLLANQHGSKPLTEVKTSTLQALSLFAKKHAVQRSNSRNGTSAQESCVSAMRCFFAVAVADGLIEKSPATELKKPTRQPSDRRGFSDEEVVTLYKVTSTGGDDPVLDTLLLRFHLETGARRGGALALRRPALLIGAMFDFVIAPHLRELGLAWDPQPFHDFCNAMHSLDWVFLGAWWWLKKPEAR
jgi:integrase/recombinase XerC